MHPVSPKLTCAGAAALAGLATATAMSAAGGGLSRFLPPLPHLALSAVFGAAVAGLLLSRGFGRPRWAGALLSLVAAPATTALGAAIGANTLMFVAACGQIADGGPGAAAGLGLIAVLGGVLTSPVVALVWALSMTGVHLATARARRLT